MQQKKIYKPAPKWKKIIGIVLAVLSVYIFMFLYSAIAGSSLKAPVQRYTEKEIKAIQKDRALPDSFDKEVRIELKIPEKDYKKSTEFINKEPKASKEKIEKAINNGELPKWYPRNEAPVLKTMVNEGLLPPVAERVGPEPVVEKGVDGIGKYGGTWLRAAINLSDVNGIKTKLSPGRILCFSPMGEPIVPFVAKYCKMLDGGKIWEVRLRKIKWSDGQPLTADDVMFWWKVYTNKWYRESSGNPPSWMMINGKYGYIEKVDKMTVRFVFPYPYGTFNYQLGKRVLIWPKHYLAKYFPEHGDTEFIKKELKAYRFASSYRLFRELIEWTNPEIPTLRPWILRRATDTSPYIFVRNPYYYAVDEKGNQLPYIDRIQFNSISADMIPVAAVQGKISMQSIHINFRNYTEIMKQLPGSNVEMYHWLPGDTSQWVIYPNSNRLVKKDEPVTKWKETLLSDKKFRQALSIAIDRNKIIKAMYSGLGKPIQIGPDSYSPLHNENFTNGYTKYEPRKANKMLDKIWEEHGLDPDKRVDGYRCTPSGKPLTFYLSVSFDHGLGPVQFVVNDWAKIGIRLTYRLINRALIYREKYSRDYDFTVWGSSSDLYPMIVPGNIIAKKGTCFATGWGSWYEFGGLYGTEASKAPGFIPVPKGSPMYKAMVTYQKAIQASTFKEQKKYWDIIYNIDAENVWTINVCGSLPVLAVASKDMKNIPKKAVFTAALESPSNAGVDSYFFEHPDNTAIKDTLAQLKNVVPLKRYDGNSGSSQVTNVNITRKITDISLKIIAILALILFIYLAIKHKFVLKRLLIMIPTTFIISIIVFTVIQLPPGSYIDYRIMELEAISASPESIKGQVDDLRAYFHFDDPTWKRYCRWAGFTWFTTFQPEDKGLLQGNMGRSMDSLKNVNDLMGDKLLMTFLISLGSILLTWILAIPIGVLSACRQYSKTDYILTLCGFAGMSIPSFFLALVIAALTGISGLFSAKYLVQPYWDFAKIIDLMKHIWVPVLIMGIAGTASMIRIMRANLLDELKKQYVTTARAKGVGPIKLLFKYPVRIAINPFVSGLGTLLPHLVSGTTLIAIVLSLPTVGPLLFDALKTQDTYLAASMLMVLSLLTLIGVLISDILLTALDPRIRMSGGKK